MRSWPRVLSRSPERSARCRIKRHAQWNKKLARAKATHREYAGSPEKYNLLNLQKRFKFGPQRAPSPKEHVQNNGMRIALVSSESSLAQGEHVPHGENS